MTATKRVPLTLDVLGRQAAETCGAVITDYWTHDTGAFVLCDGKLGFFVVPDEHGELVVEVLR